MSISIYCQDRVTKAPLACTNKEDVGVQIRLAAIFARNTLKTFVKLLDDNTRLLYINQHDLNVKYYNDRLPAIYYSIVLSEACLSALFNLSGVNPPGLVEFDKRSELFTLSKVVHGLFAILKIVYDNETSNSRNFIIPSNFLELTDELIKLLAELLGSHIPRQDPIEEIIKVPKDAYVYQVDGSQISVYSAQYLVDHPNNVPKLLHPSSTNDSVFLQNPFTTTGVLSDTLLLATMTYKNLNDAMVKNGNWHATSDCARRTFLELMDYVAR
jgi:hypothetical protein